MSGVELPLCAYFHLYVLSVLIIRKTDLMCSPHLDRYSLRGFMQGVVLGVFDL